MYPEKYTVKKVSYDFLNRLYVIHMKDTNDGEPITFRYIETPSDCLYKTAIEDEVEENRLNSNLIEKIKLSLKENRCNFNEVYCDTTVLINGKQTFDSTNNLERCDQVRVFICGQDELTKELFTTVIKYLLPVVQSEIDCKEESTVSLEYQYDAEEMSCCLSYETKMTGELGSREEIKNKIVVEKLDGDYAYLRQVDNDGDELKCVARALLPADINEGTRLHYEMMEYSVI